jgi:hypothetical protein
MIMEKMKTLTIGSTQFDVYDDEAVRFTEQTLTDEQKAQARENIRAAIDIYDIVSPEMFGAVGDGVTDDSQAFIDAFFSGKKVVCDTTKTYYFSNPIDVRTLITGHLDGNHAYFINFHMYININDEFNDWRYAYATDSFIIENMNFKNRNYWVTPPVGWETPLITSGSQMIIKNIVSQYPYILATPDRYIDKMLCDTWSFAVNPEHFESVEFTLDAISCLNQNGEYCKFNSNDTQEAAGDAWRIVHCHGFGNYPNFKMMNTVKRQPIYIDSCIGSEFEIDYACKAIFTGCHWEGGSVTTKMDYLVNVTFENCFFYDNHILNDYEGVTYRNCFFAAAYDSGTGSTLANLTNDVLFYDLKCDIENCTFGESSVINTRELKEYKYAPKKTYNWRVCDYRPKLASKTMTVGSTDVRRGLFFPAIGEYTYDVYIKATSLQDIALDYGQFSVNIPNISGQRAILHQDFVGNRFLSKCHS